MTTGTDERAKLVAEIGQIIMVEQNCGYGDIKDGQHCRMFCDDLSLHPTIERFDKCGCKNAAEALCSRLAALSPPQPSERDAGLEEAKLLKAMEQECWSLKCESYPTGGDDADVGWEVVSHHMAKPHERVIGRGSTPLKALQSALKSTPPQGSGEK